MITFFAPGISAASCSSGFGASYSPRMTSVGTPIFDRRPTAGGSSGTGGVWAWASSSGRFQLRVVISRTSSRTAGAACLGSRLGPSVHNSNEISTARAMSCLSKASFRLVYIRTTSGCFCISSSVGRNPLTPAVTGISASTISGCSRVKSRASAPPPETPIR